MLQDFFEKKERTYCTGMYGNFSDMGNAVTLCKRDTNCTAVYSLHCENTGDFRLCSTTEFHLSEIIDKPNCVYKKKQGNYKLLPSFLRIKCTS